MFSYILGIIIVHNRVYKSNAELILKFFEAENGHPPLHHPHCGRYMVKLRDGYPRLPRSVHIYLLLNVFLCFASMHFQYTFLSAVVSTKPFEFLVSCSSCLL